MRTRDKAVIVLLVGICFLSVFWKIHNFGYNISNVLPQRYYELLLNMSFDGHDNDIRLRAALPIKTDRQIVKEEYFGSPEFEFHIQRDRSNRWGTWQKNNAKGHFELVYSGTVHAVAKKYQLAPRIEIPTRAPIEVEPYLLASENIQVNAPEIRKLLDEIVPLPHRDNATVIIQAAYNYTSNTIQSITLKGTTDALTALRIGEASCGGKSRLFVALCRAGGIPSRLVGGLILKDGTWRSSHIWAEVWVAGRWVPFCPLNGYFAEIPASYLTLYYGDLSLFTHNRDINFNYYFHAKRVLAPPPKAKQLAKELPLGSLNLWFAFEQVRIPLNLLKIILMIPLGALVVVLARNIAGIQTFGTFMPALLAVAFRDTGLGWGLIVFIAILIFGGIIRYGLEKFQLLHTPKLAVLMTTTVGFLMAVILIGVATGKVLPTRVSSFPIVILTLTVERFALIWEEDGLGNTVKVVIGTLFVVAAAFVVMGWEQLQIIVVTFPEVLLLVVAALLIVGKWTGMRLSEYVRFREFIFSKG